MARLSRVRVVSVVWIAELQNLFQYFASLPIQGLRCLVIREMNGESLRPPTQICSGQVQVAPFPNQ